MPGSAESAVGYVLMISNSALPQPATPRPPLSRVRGIRPGSSQPCLAHSASLTKWPRSWVAAFWKCGIILLHMLHPSHRQERNQTRLQCVLCPVLCPPSPGANVYQKTFTQPPKAGWPPTPGTHKELEAESLAPKELTVLTA